MLRFTVVNEDGKHIEYAYNSIEELRKEYWSDNIDADIPSNDAPIVDCELKEIPLYFDTFYDIISVFGIDQSED